MNEKELGKALLGHEAGALGAVPDTRELTSRILARDRRGLRWLTGLTGLLWTLAALSIFLMLYAFLHIYPLHKENAFHASNHFTRADSERVERTHWLLVEKAMIHIMISVGALTLAAFCTIVLVFASQRATLRRVNASLVEISEELKRLRSEGTR